MGLEGSEQVATGLQDWMCHHNDLAALASLGDDDGMVSATRELLFFLPSGVDIGLPL